LLLLSANWLEAINMTVAAVSLSIFFHKQAMAQPQLFFILLALLFSPSLGANQTVNVVNNLPSTGPCGSGGNSITLFISGNGGTHTVDVGSSYSTTGDYTQAPGIGIQINNWYWTQTSLPVQVGSLFFFFTFICIFFLRSKN